VQLPINFIESLRGINGFNEDAFVKVHESEERVTSIRMNPFKKSEIVNLKSKKLNRYVSYR